MHRWYRRMKRRPSASSGTEPDSHVLKTRGMMPRAFFADTFSHRHPKL
jgi:hypothetical protein